MAYDGDYFYIASNNRYMILHDRSGETKATHDLSEGDLPIISNGWNRKCIVVTERGTKAYFLDADEGL